MFKILITRVVKTLDKNKLYAFNLSLLLKFQGLKGRNFEGESLKHSKFQKLHSKINVMNISREDIITPTFIYTCVIKSNKHFYQSRTISAHPVCLNILSKLSADILRNKKTNIKN